MLIDRERSIGTMRRLPNDCAWRGCGRRPKTSTIASRWSGSGAAAQPERRAMAGRAQQHTGPWPNWYRQEFHCLSLGNQAARDGHSVRYRRLSRLLDELAMRRAEGPYASVLMRLSKVKLLILDDWVMAKLTSDQRRDLMEVIDDRHQRGSTVLATQIPLERWHDQIGDPTYGDAILDRLVHNAYRIELRGLR
jgi:hypothetical protein